MLGLTYWLLLHQPIQPQVCSPAGSFRTSTDQGFWPSRGAATFKKKAFELSGIAFNGAPQAPRLGRAGRTALRAERSLAEAQREVSNAIEFEQFAIDMPAGGAFGHTDQRVRFPRVERELDNRTGHVPPHILATDEIVRGMVIERVALEQAAVGQTQPFVMIELVVGAHANDTPGQRVNERRPAVERSCGRISERQADVAPAHFEQLLESRAAVRIRRKQARARCDVTRDVRERLFTIPEHSRVTPSFDEKAVHEFER